MKNQIIKKIMAYLLVGAMVITTPMTASATELENAYNYNPDTGEFDTSTGTSTSTSTKTAAVEIPGDVITKVPQILGISLEPTTLEFDAPSKTKAVQARVIFDDYDPADENMQWKAITAGEKEKIEAQIHWYSDDFSVASFASNGVNDTKTGSKAVVKSVAGDQTKIYAWIEADGKAYVDKNGNILERPTEGDFIAEASVSVKNTVTTIKFDENGAKFTNGKRLYDLKKYTTLVYSDETTEPASKSNVNLTYSIDTKNLPSGVKATVTDAGVLKITKGESGSFNVDIVSEDGVHGIAKINLVKPNPVTRIAKLSDKPTLDLGLELGTEQKITYDITLPSASIENKDKTTGIDNSTDELVWSSNKPAIADVISEGNGEKATIVAKGVGTAKITVKASSGKNTAVTVKVFATPRTVEISGADSSYTGKPVTLSAVLKGDNGQILPVGNTSFKWEIAKISTKKDPNAKVSGKKEVATVTPANMLTDINKKFQMNAVTTAMVTVTYKNNTGKGTTKMPAVSYPINLTQSNVKDVNVDIFQKTNTIDKDGASVEHKYDNMYTMIPKSKPTAKNESWSVTFNGPKDLKNNKPPVFYTGQKYFMEARSTDKASQEQIDSIAWAITGKNVNYGVNGAQLTTDFTGSAKTAIKVSYISLDLKNPEKPKATKNTKTINITPVQNATSIAFAKPVVVKNPAKNTAKPQSVSFAIKNIVPKKANYGTVQWKVMAYDGEKTYVQNTTMAGAETRSNLIKKSNDKSVTIDVPGDFKAGSVIKVGAYTRVGVVAYGYIYVTEQTTKVIPQASTDNGATYSEAGTKKTNQKTIKLGDKNSTLKLSAKLETKYYENGSLVVKKGADAQDVARDAFKLGDPVYGTTTSYGTEPVTYSLDKKSALIIKIDENGNVTPLKRGTATVTIKTLSNKAAKVKIVVK